MRRVETFFIVIAIAFYAWFLTHYGPRQVIGYVRMAGWGLALTISLEALARIANTLGWRVTIEDYPPKLRFIELFAARIGGEAVDYVTPSAQLGGQFVMAVDVREKLRMPVGLATVVVASLAEAVGQIVFHVDRAGDFAAPDTGSRQPLLVDSGRVRAGGGAGGRLLFRADEAAVFASVACRDQARYRANQHRRNPRVRRRGRRGAARLLRAPSRPARRVVPVLCGRRGVSGRSKFISCCGCCISRRRCRPRCWSRRSGC